MDCVFCKIVAGEIPSVKIWEDDNFFAIFDIFPNCKGQTLVISKEHHDSDIFVLQDDYYAKYTLAVKKVISLLKQGLGVQRVGMVMEGLGVNHAHFKLYPMHGLTKDRKEYIGGRELSFDDYPGYITTEIGPKADINELQKLADSFKA
ncbi:MAG: HIT domain-containing protein [candidate division SR1 bacterium]|nr:HIT domain-containing protein [candidate division SR1 bacterium]